MTYIKKIEKKLIEAKNPEGNRIKKIWEAHVVALKKMNEKAAKLAEKYGAKIIPYTVNNRSYVKKIDKLGLKIPKLFAIKETDGTIWQPWDYSVAGFFCYKVDDGKIDELEDEIKEGHIYWHQPKSEDVFSLDDEMEGVSRWLYMGSLEPEIAKVFDHIEAWGEKHKGKGTRSIFRFNYAFEANGQKGHISCWTSGGYEGDGINLTIRLNESAGYTGGEPHAVVDRVVDFDGLKKFGPKERKELDKMLNSISSYYGKDDEFEKQQKSRLSFLVKKRAKSNKLEFNPSSRGYSAPNTLKKSDQTIIDTLAKKYKAKPWYENTMGRDFKYWMKVKVDFKNGHEAEQFYQEVAKELTVKDKYIIGLGL